jgi:hypothetical protein
MLGNDQPVPAAEGDVPLKPQQASVALVPTAAPSPGSRAAIQPVPRPSSIFVTHLIATAEQAPQTRSLRRATSADAQTAYRASQDSAACAGFRTRQII